MKTNEIQMNALSFFKGKKKFRMPTEQIVRLEGNSNYTRIFFTDHPPILMAKVLRKYETLLSPFGFLRTHRSHLVNLVHVQGLDAGGSILMLDHSRVEVSRRKKHKLSLIKKYHQTCMPTKLSTYENLI